MMNWAKIRRAGVTYRDSRCAHRQQLDRPRHRSEQLAHSDSAGLGDLMAGMNQPARVIGLEPVLTTSELAAHLGVPIQTIHDLRHSGRGPRGFRIGRELRYRVSEVEAWLAELEQSDGIARVHDGSLR